MNIKKIGKRILYLVGGLLILLLAIIFLAVSLEDGNHWYDRSSFYLYFAIVFGLITFISGFYKNFGDGVPRGKTNGEDVTKEKPE